MNSLQGDEGPRQGPEISPEDLFDMLCACCVSARACVRARVPCQSAESRQNVALHMKPVARFTSRRLALRQVVQTDRGARSSQSKTTCCCRSSSWLRCANAHSSRMPFAMPTHSRHSRAIPHGLSLWIRQCEGTRGLWVCSGCACSHCLKSSHRESRRLCTVGMPNGGEPCVRACVP